MKTAFENGINMYYKLHACGVNDFLTKCPSRFDTAEGYAKGECEVEMYGSLLELLLLWKY